MPPIVVEVAIIGAGTSGCFIASLLHEAGFDCVLIEKSRGFGGRCSRRRIQADYSIDLGAPEFPMIHIENPAIRKKVNSWIQSGYLSSWSRQSSRFDKTNNSKTIETLCATPSMNAWHKSIAGHINALTGCKVNSVSKVDGHWHLLDEHGQLISSARKVIITSPPEQAADLLKDCDGFSYGKRMSHESLPQYVCAIGFTLPLNINADVYRDGHEVLAAAIRENSKPRRDIPSPWQEVWVLHSTHEWARQHSDAAHQKVAIALTEAFQHHFATDVEPRILTSHYWRLARHQIDASQHPPFIWDDTLQIGCCGDWLDSGDIGGALNSGLGLFEKITDT